MSRTSGLTRRVLIVLAGCAVAVGVALVSSQSASAVAMPKNCQSKAQPKVDWSNCTFPSPSAIKTQVCDKYGACTGIDFSGANFTNTTFAQTGSYYTNEYYLFNGANFTGANFTGAKGVCSERWTRTHMLKGARQWYVENDAILTDYAADANVYPTIDFSGANFTNANLTNADFHNCAFPYVNFTGTILANTDLTNTTMWGVKSLGGVTGTPKLSNVGYVSAGKSGCTYPTSKVDSVYNTKAMAIGVSCATTNGWWLWTAKLDTEALLTYGERWDSFLDVTPVIAGGFFLSPAPNLQGANLAGVDLTALSKVVGVAPNGEAWNGTGGPISGGITGTPTLPSNMKLTNGCISVTLPNSPNGNKSAQSYPCRSWVGYTY